MKTLVLTLLTCIATLLAYGQESIRWNDNLQLSWDDFSGKVNDTSRFDAECFAEIRYNYKFYSPTNFEFEVYANFDKENSWSRKQKQSELLLKHEQMHFNIAELYAEKLKRDFDTYIYTAATYDSEILDLFKNVKLEYEATQLRYDEETNHSRNKEKQKEWEEFVAGELRKTRLSLQLVQNVRKD